MDAQPRIRAVSSSQRPGAFSADGIDAVFTIPLLTPPDTLGGELAFTRLGSPAGHPTIDILILFPISPAFRTAFGRGSKRSTLLRMRIWTAVWLDNTPSKSKTINLAPLLPAKIDHGLA